MGDRKTFSEYWPTLVEHALQHHPTRLGRDCAHNEVIEFDWGS